MSTMTPKLQVTRNYRMFKRSDANRQTNVRKHRKLKESMKRYGFLPCYPIVCRRDQHGNLVVKDGQHRLVLAEMLDIAVYWMEIEVDFDVAVINCTSKGWLLRDYAETHAQNGKYAYTFGLQFAKEHSLPIGTAFALLAGVNSFSQVSDDFTEGNFQVKERKWAEAVAAVYTPVVKMAKACKNARFVEACMAATRVEGFDPKRFLSGCEKKREELVSYTTRDLYLAMMERLYNFGRKTPVPLVIPAQNAMKARKKEAAEPDHEPPGIPGSVLNPVPEPPADATPPAPAPEPMEIPAQGASQIPERHGEL